MALADGQFAYGGLTLGRDTPFWLQRVQGLEGVSARFNDHPVPRGHGSVASAQYQAARLVTLEFAVAGASLLPGYLASLREAFAVRTHDAETLVWKRTGQPERMVWARPVELPVVEAVPYVGVLNRPMIALRCDDPRIYSAELHTETVQPFDPAGGGADWPVDGGAKDFPAGTSSEAVLTNAGADDAWPTLRFYGPRDGGTLTAVQLTNRTTGVVLTVDTAVGAGQVLTVDMRALVTGNGDLVIGIDGASRYGSWRQPRTPFALAPGDNVLRLETTGTTQDAPCIVNWRDTWLS